MIGDYDWIGVIEASPEPTLAAEVVLDTAPVHVGVGGPVLVVHKPIKRQFMSSLRIFQHFHGYTNSIEI